MDELRISAIRKILPFFKIDKDKWDSGTRVGKKSINLNTCFQPPSDWLYVRKNNAWKRIIWYPKHHDSLRQVTFEELLNAFETKYGGR